MTEKITKIHEVQNLIDQYEWCGTHDHILIDLIIYQDKMLKALPTKIFSKVVSSLFAREYPQPLLTQTQMQTQVDEVLGEIVKTSGSAFRFNNRSYVLPPAKLTRREKVQTIEVENEPSEVELNLLNLPASIRKDAELLLQNGWSNNEIILKYNL